MKTENAILNRLGHADLTRLSPHLECIELSQGMRLQRYRAPIQHAYFIEKGLVSIVARGTSNPGLQVAMVGPEGMIGMSLLLGARESPLVDSHVQASGTARRVSAASLLACIDASPPMHRVMLESVNDYLGALQRTVLTTAFRTIEQRTANWIVLADRQCSGLLGVTHQEIAEALGIARPGATLALSRLATLGLIHCGRRAITIHDHKGLQQFARG